MNRESQDKSSADAAQGVSEQGDRVVDLLVRQRRVAFRIAAIEGGPIEADEPDPQVVRGVRELFNDPHPGLADLQACSKTSKPTLTVSSAGRPARSKSSSPGAARPSFCSMGARTMTDRTTEARPAWMVFAMYNPFDFEEEVIQLTIWQGEDVGDTTWQAHLDYGGIDDLPGESELTLSGPNWRGLLVDAASILMRRLDVVALDDVAVHIHDDDRFQQAIKNEADTIVRRLVLQ